MKAWGEQAVMMCEHSQIIPIGSIVDAVLAVRCQDAEALRSDNEDLRKRVDAADAAIARVRRLCNLTIECSVRADAIDQARDTLAALDRQE
jgi:exosome complex RNA-binding protein Rrp4